MSDERDDDFPTCIICGAPLEWEHCWKGCDEGFFDEADYDPVNYSEGECLTPCDECHGKGGYLLCTNLPHTDEQMEAWKNRPVGWVPGDPGYPPEGA